MTNTKLKGLLITILLVLILTITFLVNSSETMKYLSRQRIIPPNASVLQSLNRGGPVIGQILYELYPHDAVLTVERGAKKGIYWKSHSIKISGVGLYAYPIKFRYGDFKYVLTKDEFEFLKGNAIYSTSLQNNRRYYFLKTQTLHEEEDKELGMFIYETEVVVAPVKWRYAEGG